MRPLLSALTLCALMLAGCMPRSELADDERVMVATIAHGKSKDDAFNVAELWVAETYVSGKTVTDLRQPATGILVVKPMYRWASAPLSNAPTDYSPYTLRVDSVQGSTRIRYEMGRGEKHGSYPPDSEMRELRAKEWAKPVRDLAVRLGGTADLPPELPPAPEAERAPAGKGAAR